MARWTEADLARVTSKAGYRECAPQVKRVDEDNNCTLADRVEIPHSDEVKFDIEKLHESYLRTGSVHRTAAEFNSSGETVRKHLTQAGKRLNRSKWTNVEIELLRLAYAMPDGFDIAVIAKSFGRTHAAVACKADELGLCSGRGKHIVTESARKNMSVAQKEVTSRPGVKEERSSQVAASIKANGHPRGMLGKHHTQEARDAISRFHSGKKAPRDRVEKQMATRISRYGSLAPKTTRGSWKAAWHEIGGVRFFARSKWESNYAHYLEWRRSKGEILKWEHEPETFWFKGVKRGVVSYLPDFRVTFPCGRVEYHEVKGWMDSKSVTKIKRMAKYHPTTTLVVIDSKRYRALDRQLSKIVQGWM